MSSHIILSSSISRDQEVWLLPLASRVPHSSPNGTLAVFQRRRRIRLFRRRLGLSAHPSAALSPAPRSGPTALCFQSPAVRAVRSVQRRKAACSLAVKLMGLDPQGRWFDPWCGRDKICTAVGPLRKALNPTLLQGVCLLLSLIYCKSLWIKASAK